MSAFSFYEFFAGGGMVRAGLGSAWRCLFANDIDPKKAAAYRANWGDADLHVGDVHDLAADMLPGRADLAWGSFPCQDLSLAGCGAGLSGAHSGAFWGFMNAIDRLRAAGRAPRMLALENVCGTLTSHDGRDFAAICGALHKAGYRFGALVIDAALFLPQSRQRLFIVAIDGGCKPPDELLAAGPDPAWHPKSLVGARAALDTAARDGWLWWRLDPPRANRPTLAEIVADKSAAMPWRGEDDTKALIELMSPLHRERLEAIRRSGGRHVGAVYKRIRPDGAGGKRQRAEVRFDGLAGCLRTPAGGSSRQTLLEITDGRVRSRLMSPREAARLMGLSDNYVLPAKYNDAYKIAGDGVAVPAVRFLATQLFEPILRGAAPTRLAG